MSTLALNNLANYILSLGLSQRNRRWLAERLVEAEQKADDDTAYIEASPAMMQAIQESRRELTEGRGTKVEVEDLWK